MSETIRRLANSSSFSALQDKINGLKENYAVSDCIECDFAEENNVTLKIILVPAHSI